MASRMAQGPRKAGRAYIVILILAALVPLAALRALKAFDVPLGRPDTFTATTSGPATSTAATARHSRTFVYLYSVVPAIRLRNATMMLPVAACAAFAVMLAASSTAGRRRAGLWLGFATIAASAYWSYVAPPSHISQHLFTLQSPSHDGAFVREARFVDSIPRYLSRFQVRARATEERMWGTRVISNPPLATILAVLVKRSVRKWPALHDAAFRPLAAEMGMLPRPIIESGVTSIVYGWVLTVLWAAAGVTCYFLGRLFLGVPAALVFAICCVVSPMTQLFSPGKDPAQLLSISGALYLWLAAYRRPRGWLAALAGIAAVLTSMIGLIHIWIGLIALAATACHAIRVTRRVREFVTHCVIPGVVGVIATVVFLQVTLRWNVMAIILAVSQSQAEVTRGGLAMPLAWQALGIPLFLLFAGPALWSMTLWQSLGCKRDPDARLGLYLQWGAAAVMVATVGFTNIETPRLWIAFVPLLLLGAAMRLPAFSSGRLLKVRLLAALVGAQLAASALQWTFMDMRETEMRMIDHRYYN